MSVALRILIFLLLLCGVAYAEKVVTIQWDHSIDAPYLQSYRVYYTAATARPQTYVVENVSTVMTVPETTTITLTGESIIYTVAATSANTLRIYSTGSENVTFEVYYSGEYHEISDIDLTANSYTEIEIGSTQTVTAVRITLTADESLTVSDAQAMLLDSDSTITLSGDDLGYFDIYKDNTEIELHYISNEPVVRCYALSAIDTRGLESILTEYVCSGTGVIKFGGDGAMGISGSGTSKIEAIPE